MNKLLENLDFKVYTESIIKAHSEGSKRLIQGYASVGDVLDRQNEVITLGALVRAKEDLLNNSTIFFNHEHNSLPIGKTIAAEVDGKGLLITVEISQSKSADDIWTLIEEGILDRFSIGGKVLEAEERRDSKGNLFNEITKIELFETSVVGLPANPDAAFRVISKSFSQVITEEMRRKGEDKNMAKEIKEVEKSEEVVLSEGTSNSTETVVEVVKSEETSQEVEKSEEVIEKSEEVESEEVVETPEVEKSEKEVTLTKEERKAQLLKELKELEEEDSIKADKDEEVEVTSQETSPVKVEDVKSTDEKILDKLDALLQVLAKTEVESEETKPEEVLEESTEESLVEADAVVEVKGEIKEEPVLEESNKSVEVPEDENLEKNVKVQEKEVIEEEIIRKGQIEVVVAEAPYGSETEQLLNKKDAEKLLKKSKDKAWCNLLFGR